MKKKKVKSDGFFCKECGHESLTYLGKCPACSAWGSFTEQPIVNNSTNLINNLANLPNGTFNIHESGSLALKLSEIPILSLKQRLNTGFEELNNVLGGGLQAGSFLLIGGDPGIGKSTLLLQVIGYIADQGLQTLYVSGEESLQQVKQRSLRLEVSQELCFMAETNLEHILAEVEKLSPEILVIDSIQAIYLDDKNSFPGSPSQIRDCATLLMQIAKKKNIITLIVGHITKDGNIAGPKLLEHMVDVVLYFEGDKQNYFRMIRSVKNRFGPTEEVGLFEMQETGLAEVKNPSALFLTDNPENSERRSGTIITATMQGNRVLLAEIQALVGYTTYAQPKRMVNGLDYNRVNQVAAILERRLGLALSKQDIYTSVVGGLNIIEPATDLAIALSIISCVRNLELKSKLIVLGEIGLTGEIRPIPKLEARLKEAYKLGFERAIVPKQKLGIGSNLPNKMEIHSISKLSEALAFAFPPIVKNKNV